MAFKDLFIKEESAPLTQPVVAQEVAPKAENIMPSQPVKGRAPVDKWIFNTKQFIEYSNELTQHLEEVCK